MSSRLSHPYTYWSMGSQYKRHSHTIYSRPSVPEWRLSDKRSVSYHFDKPLVDDGLAALTVRWLSSTQNFPPRIIVCTGERMESLITKLYSKEGVKTSTFEPVHSKGLSNEFFCYANFECEAWKWKTLVAWREWRVPQQPCMVLIYLQRVDTETMRRLKLASSPEYYTLTIYTKHV